MASSALPTIIERLNPLLVGDWTDTLNCFRVNDVPAGTDAQRSLLICESPHAAEVTADPIHRYPLRGTAGKVITKALAVCEEPVATQCVGQGRDTVPIGQLLNQGRINVFRIVNVCELPLQSEAYAQRLDDAIVQHLPQELPFREWCRLILAFRTVRELRRNTPEIHDPLVDQILTDFRSRLGDLQDLQNRPALVCGLAPQACWCLLELPTPNGSNRVTFVAHPSCHSAWFAGQQLKDHVRRGLERLICIS